MSEISLNIRHASQLWTMHERGEGLKVYTHDLTEMGAQVKFYDFGITVTCEIDLSEREQDSLLNCLVKDQIPYIPHWQALTPDIHRTVQIIESKLMDVARLADHGFRKVPKGIRLPPAKVTKTYLNQSQGFPIMNWKLSDNEKERLSEIISGFSLEAQKKYENGIVQIPLSISFGQKQIFMDDAEVEAAFQNMNTGDSIPPFWTLYGLAWENFSQNRSHDAAILILATSLETALKWCLMSQGDDISNFLIDNIPSPPLRKLYECACQYTAFDFPEHFSGWLHQLSTARNFVAHKPKGFKIDMLLLGRWFAIGEAILKAISGKDNEPLVGYLVKPIGERASEQFTDDACGVVLRREAFRNTEEEKLHVLMDTGETYYFSDSSFETLPDKKQKFPDIK
ncbi:MAG: hypothetical protein GY814_10845 [Gammaproteobacteria bacterium]|nr:hypothetical protein [Gammaproteobacteria bacterium]